LPGIQVARRASQPEPGRVLAGAAMLLPQPCGQTSRGASWPEQLLQSHANKKHEPAADRITPGELELRSEFLHEGHPMRKMLIDFKCMDKRKCKREKSAEIAGEIRSPRKILETPAKTRLEISIADMTQL